MLYIGLDSLAHFLMGREVEAAEIAGQILIDLKYIPDISSIIDFESRHGFCPIESWAYYYLCRSMINLKSVDEMASKRKADAVFTKAFSLGHHRNWTIPSLIQILADESWKRNFPAYFEEVASIVYVGTSSGISSAFRKVSVIFGRQKVRVLPAVGAFGVATAGIVLWMLETGVNGVINKEDVDGAILYVGNSLSVARDHLLAGGFDNLDGFNELSEEIENKSRVFLDTIVASGADISEVIGNLLSDQSSASIVASNGNEVVIV